MIHPPEPRRLDKREAGRLGARARWGAQRIVRLDQLDADTARLIRALLAQNEASTVSETSAEASAEVRRGSVDSAA